jgi:hypothetical protein
MKANFADLAAKKVDALHVPHSDLHSELRYFGHYLSGFKHSSRKITKSFLVSKYQPILKE